MKVETKGRRMRSCEVVLRLLALALTLVAAIVLGVNKETKMVPMTLSPSLPPLNVPVTAKWRYLSAFVFFVVSNAIACAYAVLSLILMITGGRKGLASMIIIFDTLIVALLFSGNGAAVAIGVLGYEGNSHVRWNKVCNVFTNFCHRVAAAVVLSLIGSLAFVLLAVISALRLQKRSSM